MPLKLAVVTASIDPVKTQEYWGSWNELAEGEYRQYHVLNGVSKVESGSAQPIDFTLLASAEILGPVAAFEWGIRKAAEDGADIIAALHDDLRIEQKGWDLEILATFAAINPLLVGFGGGRKLGRPGMYQEPYDPMSLARHDFISNMRDAENHGRRVTELTRVACLDGFSQIGRASFMAQSYTYMKEKGVIHHAYDSWLGVLAARWGRIVDPRGEDGYGTYMLPIACHHAGGVTAVGNEDYQKWAAEKIEGGDAGLWQAAHRIVWEDSRDILPLGW